MTSDYMGAAGAVADELATAKHNVKWLLDHPTGLVDMKGIAYWAKRVEQLREELRQL